MDYDTRHWQYRQLITVYHGSNFGHYMELERQLKGRNATHRTGLGQWNGPGVPEDVLRTASGLIVAAFEEHLVTRYGVKGELPLEWGGDPAPF